MMNAWIQSAPPAPIKTDILFTTWTLFSLLAMGQSSGLLLTRMDAPTVADLRDEMELDCHFDMGKEELYAVKWYKDDQEFFRYIPTLAQSTMVFPVAGVHLVPASAAQWSNSGGGGSGGGGADCNNHHCKVKLWKLSRAHSGGAYRCEISSEAPAFRLASKTHNITVAALPRKSPRIEGLTSSSAYMEGDIVTAKCISDHSDPAPILTWYINGQSAHRQTVGEPISSEPDSLGLVSRSISIRFTAERNKYSRGDNGRRSDNSAMEIKCESALPGVPIPPQQTTLVIPLRSAQHTDPQVINNQKLLHWYSSSNAAATAGIFKSGSMVANKCLINIFISYFDMVKSFLFVEVVRWYMSC